VRAYIGLGSNLGDRAAMLYSSVELLGRTSNIRVLRRSSCYETEPVGVPDQPWFVNAVLEIETAQSPRELLQTLKGAEAVLGRRPGRRWGERAIDLDLLLYDELGVDERDLIIPHPELWRRLFVLVPLAELRPDLRSPEGRSIGGVIAGLRGSQAIHPFVPQTA
jgi:2-amino-4-hydroxy-6-hydroxymethyldihydropteridine diphosphokinase